MSLLKISDKPTVLQMAVKNELSLIDEPSDVVCSVNGYPPPKITWFARKCMNYPSCEQELTELSSVSYINFSYIRSVRNIHQLKIWNGFQRLL